MVAEAISPESSIFTAGNVTFKSEKFTPPMIHPMGGMMMSLTIEETILPKAPPMITPTAMSTAFPFTANSLNSFTNFPIVVVWF